MCAHEQAGLLQRPPMPVPAAPGVKADMASRKKGSAGRTSDSEGSHKKGGAKQSDKPSAAKSSGQLVDALEMQMEVPLRRQKDQEQDDKVSRQRYLDICLCSVWPKLSMLQLIVGYLCRLLQTTRLWPTWASPHSRREGSTC